MPETWQQWYPRYVEKWDSSKRLASLSDAAYRAVDSLLSAQFQSEDGMLPSNDRELKALSGRNGDWPAVRKEVLWYFRGKADGRIFDPVMLETWKRSREVHQKRLESAHLGGRKPKANRTDTERIPNGSHTETERAPKPDTVTDTYTETREVDIEASVAKELTSAAPSKLGDTPAGTIPLKDGTNFQVTEQRIAGWAASYPGVDVLQELRAMRDWCLSSPKRRKSQGSILKFISAWLVREQRAAATKAEKFTPATVGSPRIHSDPLPNQLTAEEDAELKAWQASGLPESEWRNWRKGYKASLTGAAVGASAGG